MHILSASRGGVKFNSQSSLNQTWFLVSRLEIYVAQKLRFDGRGSSRQRRGQRQGQRLLVVRRLGVARGGTGGGRSSRGSAIRWGHSAAARGSATSGPITSTDAANCQAYKIIRDTR